MTRIHALAIVALAGITLSAHAMDAPTAHAWKKDLTVYRQGLEAHHIDLYHAVSQRKFHKQLQQLERSLPNLNDDQVIVELMRLTHEIGDGHTAVPLWHQNSLHFPLELTLLDGKLYVTGTTDTHSDLLGARLKSVGTVRDDSLNRRLSAVAPFAENPYSTAVRVAEYVPNATVLHGLGIIPDKGATRFRFRLNGNTREVTLSPIESPAINQRLGYRHHPQFKRQAAVNDDFWLGSSNNGKTAYIDFHRYPTYEQMTQFAPSVLQFLNQHQTRDLIIDLRGNYGGDLFTGLLLAAYLVQADSIDWKSSVYVLIDNATFSAAMSNAAQYAQLLNAKLVGQPTGGRPSGYQDMGTFTLPNSKLLVTYSKRLYRFKDGHPDALYPDVRIDTGIDDYLSGTDKALNWIIQDIGKLPSAH